MDFVKEKPRLGGGVINNRDNYNSNSLSKCNRSNASATEIAAALKGKKSGNGWICRCPAHDDNSPSLSIRNDASGKLLLHCFAGCSFEIIIAKLKRIGLDGSNGYIEPFTSKPNFVQKNQSLDWSSKAEYIWRKSTALQGTAVAAYLFKRGCAIPTGDDVRFLPTYKDGYPAMLSRITDAITGNPISLHFTYLLTDGGSKAPIKPAKKTLFGHRIKGGVIRLTPDDEVTLGLGLAEGIETALTCAKSGWSPVWAAGNKNNIADFPILDAIESLTIFADHDKGGLEAATVCAQRWLRTGREVKIVPSPTYKTDWNDVYGRAV